MAVLDAKLPAWQASTKAVSPTKAEAKVLEGKAPLVIDGGALGSSVRVLLKDQTKPEQNGLFEVTTNEAFAGTGTFAVTGKFAVGSAWVLTRTPDADSSGEVTEGMLVPVEDGETNQRTSWVQRSTGPIEVGVSAQTFESIAALPAGDIKDGQLESTYVAPLIKEAVIDNSKVEGKAEIDASKLNLKAGVASTDLATSAKQLFPQLVSAGTHKVNAGIIEVEFPGGSNFSTKEYEVEHGVGEGARVWLSAVVANIKATLPPNVYLTEDPTATIFKMQAWVNGLPAKGTKVKVHWLAMA